MKQKWKWEVARCRGTKKKKKKRIQKYESIVNVSSFRDMKRALLIWKYEKFNIENMRGNKIKWARRGGREKGDVRSDCDKKRNKTMRWKGIVCTNLYVLGKEEPV